MLAPGKRPACLQPAIRGKITDLLDCPVASARVALSGAKLEDKLNSVTGVEGIFMFCRIPPGSYTLEVICNGFNKLVQRGIAVRDRTITGLDLKMDFMEDSRTINLRALSLEYFNDAPPPPDSLPSDLPRHLSEVTAELSLARALFNPPAALEVGRAVIVELGVYQDLVGEVMHPGATAMLPNMTVLQALSSAGLSQFANTKRIYVLRTENGKQQKLPVNYRKLVKGEEIEQNYLLQPGDTIVVP